MKKKFIAIGFTILLLVALLAIFTSPLMVAPKADEAEATGIIAVEAVDLAVMDGEAGVIIESNEVSVPVSAMEIAPWVALGASLTILAVVYRRRFNKILGMDLRSSDISVNWWPKMGGGPNKFILPMAA